MRARRSTARAESGCAGRAFAGRDPRQNGQGLAPVHGRPAGPAVSIGLTSCFIKCRRGPLADVWLEQRTFIPLATSPNLAHPTKNSAKTNKKANQSVRPRGPALAAPTGTPALDGRGPARGGCHRRGRPHAGWNVRKSCRAVCATLCHSGENGMRERGMMRRILLFMLVASGFTHADVTCREFGHSTVCRDGKNEWRGRDFGPDAVLWTDGTSRTIRQSNFGGSVVFSGAGADAAGPSLMGARQVQRMRAPAPRPHVAPIQGTPVPVAKWPDYTPKPGERQRVIPSACPGFPGPDGKCVL